MFIFNMMEKVDNRADNMLAVMRFEMDWRLNAAKHLESQAHCIKRPENYDMKQMMLDTACKCRREVLEISDCYYKLKDVMNKLH